MSYLLKKIGKKTFSSVRKYECPLWKEDFYFRQRVIADNKILADEKLQKEYGGEDSDEYQLAMYLYLSCDEKGNCEYQDLLEEPKKLMPVIHQLMETPGFTHHATKALAFAVHGAPVSEDDLVSSKEGSVAASKKQSSKTVSKD